MALSLKKQVVSLKLAKQLKELSVKQDSLWYYKHSPNWNKGELYFDYEKREYSHNQTNWWKEQGYDYYSAFTASELGKMLPPKVDLKGDKKNSLLRLEIYKDEKGKDLWIVGCWEMSVDLVEPQRALNANFISTGSLVKSMAVMLIYLLENNLIKPEDLCT